MFSIDLLKLRTMNRARPLQVREIVGMAMPVGVALRRSRHAPIAIQAPNPINATLAIVSTQ
jgi:hypothetical protein